MNMCCLHLPRCGGHMFKHSEQIITALTFKPNRYFRAELYLQIPYKRCNSWTLKNCPESTALGLGVGNPWLRLCHSAWNPLITNQVLVERDPPQLELSLLKGRYLGLWMLLKMLQCFNLSQRNTTTNLFVSSSFSVPVLGATWSKRDKKTLMSEYSQY